MCCDARSRVVTEEFDRFVAVDYSASSTPKRGVDSLWVALADGDHPIRTWNFATRAELTEHVLGWAQRPGRTLVVLDVALGFPEGFAQALDLSGMPWRATARLLADMLEEGPRNRNNRFDVANELNRRAGAALLWGHPHGRTYRWLSPTTTPQRGVAPCPIPPGRRVERHVRGAIKSPLQLLGAGSVGSQSLVAQAMVERWRAEVTLSVWPFEVPRTPVVIAESFFSLAPWRSARGSVRDEQQVRAVAAWLRTQHRTHMPLTRFSLLRALPTSDREVVRREEGWLLGLSSSADNVEPT